eukprot:1538424-Ditylum_brightwellii.AAC.1
MKGYKQPHHIPYQHGKLPSLRIPPIFIITPKGCKAVNVPHQPSAPHVIPNDMYRLNHVMTIQPNTQGEKFAEATQHLTMSQMFANAVIDEETGQPLDYRYLIQDPKYQKIWATSCTNKFGRLAQGV